LRRGGGESAFFYHQYKYPKTSAIPTRRSHVEKMRLLSTTTITCQKVEKGGIIPENLIKNGSATMTADDNGRTFVWNQRWDPGWGGEKGVRVIYPIGAVWEGGEEKLPVEFKIRMRKKGRGRLFPKLRKDRNTQNRHAAP